MAPASSCEIVAIALQSSDADLPLSFIKTARQAGYLVIGYEHRLESWSLRSRCRPLIAGSYKVLDSADPQFEEQLATVLRTMFQRERQKQDERDHLMQDMHATGIVGTSEATLSMFQLVKRVSHLSDVPVLISGETGTGKELIAGAMHKLDARRSEGPFVPVNCGALHATLAESELFGHRRGAFTGADRDRLGLFRAAHGGILFLDEIGELDPTLQAKLLRVLQEGRVRGVGYEHEVPIDVRIIAATNRNLKQMVQAGTFRADLFHRLNVLKVELLPLRERPGDVPLLIQHFLNRTGRAWHASSDFVEAVTSLSLPGNVRELDNLIKRVAANKEDSSPLTLSDLPEDILCTITGEYARPDQSSGVKTTAPPADQSVPASSEMNIFQPFLQPLHSGRTLEASLQEYERLIVDAALKHSNGCQSAAALILGITPRSVYNKVKKYGLSAR